MKKLMFAAVAAFCGTVMAIESANVVGYYTSPTVEGGQLVSAAFMKPGSTGFWVSDIKLTGYQEDTAFVDNADKICDEILTFTKCHPYYTQQLASQVWEKASKGELHDMVNGAIERLLEFHDLNFERIWLNFNNTDKRILMWLANNNKPYTLQGIAQSTISSSLKRMLKDGYVIKTMEYEVEDPFFRNWILAH